ncbi:non-canonical purine NTP pyrophosphatase, RdgB/HAM1 family [Corynebacterium sp. 13CS0277]|nr:non-canonical purine NTP pyrophosphatase, RdgB/HAM1 family [Corynebacterium sp. 13CS0277]
MLLHVATHNPKKLKELHRVLQEAGIEGVELVSSEDLLGYPEPVEDGRTFADNALIKARAGAKETHLVTLADDSGLSVDELGGMPGVLSARWSGTHGDDEANNELLLKQLEHVPHGRRTARFVSVCAVVTPEGDEFLEKGTWEGRLVRTPVGDEGFGYDPLFIPAEEDERVEDLDERPRTSAELTPAEKDALSHRGKALKALVPVIAELATKYAEDGTAVTSEDDSPIVVVTPEEAAGEEGADGDPAVSEQAAAAEAAVVAEGVTALPEEATVPNGE